MSKGIKELHDAILRVTQSVVVHTPKYSKFGGYDGENDIYTMDIARVLYHQEGYRKQSVGEWVEQVKVARQSNLPPLHYYKCSLCDVYLIKRAHFCPNCGARMKGGE